MTTQPLLKRLTRMFAVCAISLAGAVTSLTTHAEPFYLHKDGAMVYDEGLGLVWTRCPIPSKWNGKECEGSPATVSDYQMTSLVQKLNNEDKFGGFNDWRLPSIQELMSIRYCRRGFSAFAMLSAYEEYGSCVGGSSYSEPAFSTNIFPINRYKTEAFWSNTPFSTSSQNAIHRHKSGFWILYADGLLRDYSLDKASALLVKDQVNKQRAIELGFVERIYTQEETRVLEVARLSREKDELARKEALEDQRKRDEEDRRAKAKRASAIPKLMAGGAQSLYLQAGRAQRSGSVEVGGVTFYASELYEMIVEKFPKSEYAVKASDQLNAMDRSDRQASAAREGQERNRQQQQAQSNANRQQCEAQKATCNAACGDRVSAFGRSDDSYWRIVRCQSNCNSVSCY